MTTRNKEVAMRRQGHAPYLTVVPFQGQQVLKLVGIPVLDHLVFACKGLKCECNACCQAQA